MPLYEYYCEQCNLAFEKRVPVNDRDNVLCARRHPTKRRMASPDQIWNTTGRAKTTTYPPSELGPNGDIS